MKIGYKIALLLMLLLVKVNSFAQCAMCKAVAESDFQSGGTATKGVNDGIYYLMLIPYLLMATVGYLIYRHYKKSKLTESN